MQVKKEHKFLNGSHYCTYKQKREDKKIVKLDVSGRKGNHKAIKRVFLDQIRKICTKLLKLNC